MGIVNKARKTNIFGADLGIDFAWEYFNTSYQEYELENKLLEDENHIGYCCDLIKPDEAYQGFTMEYVRIFNDHFNTNLEFIEHINDVGGWGLTRSLFKFSDEDIKSLELYINENDLQDDLSQQLIDSTSYRSGFIPFITDIDLLKNDDSYFEVLINTIMIGRMIDIFDVMDYHNALSEWFYATDLTELEFVENDR